MYHFHNHERNTWNLSFRLDITAHVMHIHGCSEFVWRIPHTLSNTEVMRIVNFHRPVMFSVMAFYWAKLYSSKRVLTGGGIILK